MIDFDGQNHYQEGLAFRAVKAATKLSHRDAAEHVSEFTSGLSRSTIHRRVKRFGGRMRDFLHDGVAGIAAETVMADGTVLLRPRDGSPQAHQHIQGLSHKA